MLIQRLSYQKEFFPRNVDFVLIKSMKYAWSIHCHDFYEIFLILDGTMEHIANDKSEFLCKNDLVFVRPDDVHWFNEVKGYDCSYLNITFTEKILKHILLFLGNENTVEHYLRMPTCIKCKISDKLFDEIICCYNDISTLILNSCDVQVMAQILLAKIFQYYIKKEINQNNFPTWFNDLCRNISQKENFTSKSSILCELSGKTYEHISRSFKKYLNTTPTDYINNLRLNYFANLLMMTDMPILDICYECGFSSLSHAYHLFKKEYNLTPLKYRENHRHILV